MESPCASPGSSAVSYTHLEKMKELGKGKNLPAILTGDFNVDQTHQSYDAFVNLSLIHI